MGNIKDSGKTQEFKSGAHRDDAVGKGRPDLIPISSCSSFDDPVLDCIKRYIETEDESLLDDAITQSLADAVVIRPNGKVKKIPDTATDAEARAAVLLDVSLLYEAGADKYGENNWQKGMPVIRFLQSAMRHWLKHKAGWRDEPITGRLSGTFSVLSGCTGKSPNTVSVQKLPTTKQATKLRLPPMKPRLPSIWSSPMALLVRRESP